MNSHMKVQETIKRTVKFLIALTDQNDKRKIK